MDYRLIAARWRAAQPQPRASEGVVLIWNGAVYGWKSRLCDARHERPSVRAVDALGHVFVAQGGNDDTGALAWVVVP